MDTSTRKTKLSNLNVTNIEEEIMLIKESEEEYNKNWGIDAREAYIKGLKYFDNLK